MVMKNNTDTSSPNNDVLYHYCSVSSMMSIIRSRCLWLTNCLYSNDSKEIFWAIEKVKDATAHVIKFNQELSSKEQALEIMDFQRKQIIEEKQSLESININSGTSINENILNYCQEILESTPADTIKSNSFATAVQNLLLDNLLPDLQQNIFPTYMFCLSNVKDGLVLWRGYGDDGRGVAIGFNQHILSELQGICDVHLKPIIYDDSIQKEMIGIGMMVYASDSVQIKNWAYNILPTFKGDCFVEEKESRLIFVDKGNARLKINAYLRNNKIVKCYELPIMNNYITEIILGPKCDIDIEDLIMFFKFFGFNITKKQIIKSAIPYR
jgi:hypothetical protein